MKARNIELVLQTALSDTPVVLLNGARQTGKSTLALQFAKEKNGRYLTLDDATTLAGALSDPSGFLHHQEGFTVIDEVQKAPSLFPAIKIAVDQARKPGQFFLTGSANVLLLPQVSESLAGRMEIVSLYPFSQGELAQRQESFIDLVFSSLPPSIPKSTLSLAQLCKRMLTGGFPEVVTRPSQPRQAAWFASYVTAILQRDVRDVAHIEDLTALPRLLHILAARTGGLLNFSELSRVTTIPQTTLKRYLSLLETTFIFQPLPAWSANVSKRVIKSPKIYLLDSGLSAHVTGLTVDRLSTQPSALGPLYETFVLGELRKQATWSNHRVSLFHYRTTTGREVDLILENQQGKLVGIEIKASSTVTKKDFAGLETFAQDTQKNFVRGIILYGGKDAVAFGENLYAWPMSALWQLSQTS
ncbi:MAG: ATP-binding protein [Nitrospira sp.]|nr:ATP-binding protein [Nitrospira sp.]